MRIFLLPAVPPQSPPHQPVERGASTLALKRLSSTLRGRLASLEPIHGQAINQGGRCTNSVLVQLVHRLAQVVDH